MKQELINLYLDWFNNFLTVERFAEYYQMPIFMALIVIRSGKLLYEKDIKI